MTLSFFSRIKFRGWEKIPSTFVFVVLTIHVLGLGAAVYVSRCAGVEQAKQTVVGMVGESLTQFAQARAVVGLERSEQLHQALREFNLPKRWDELRIIAANGQIVGSLHEQEQGTQHAQMRQLQQDWPVGLVVEWEHRGSELLERARFRVPLGSVAGENKLILEGVVRIAPLVPAWSVLNGPVVAVFLGSFVLLLLFCRLMCKRMLPLVRIGSNLVRHQSRLRDEISSLRLASETDSVAKAWNQLMGLFEEMRDSVAQANAHRELNTALERSASSAFVEATNVVPEGVMYVARGERLCYANKMACRLLGIEFEEDSTRSGGGHKLLGDLPVSDLGQKIVAAVQSAKASQKFESKSVNVEGESESAFRVRVMPVLQKDPGAIVMITDVSQQAKADAAREAFLAQVTHELRTPLTNIRAYTETYAEFDDPKVQAECFNVINKETRRLARLVEEMLSRSQLDVGSMTVRRDDVDLLSLVGESVRDLNATAKSKGIDLQAKLPSKLPALRADRDKLAVVINNLLGNALKYTESGGSVSVACQADDEQVRILVSDTGIGIGEDDQHRIFEHLYRVDSQEVRDQLGSGIGLTTALEIIKAHGGDITVKSAAGKGSTFTIELPLAAAAASREA